MSRQDNMDLKNLNDELSQEVKNYHSDHEQNFEGKRKKKRPKKKKIKLWKKILIIVILLLVLCMAAAAVLFASGKSSLFQDLVNMENAIDGAQTEENGDLVIYNGEKYRYNKNVTSILCMGIDNEEIADDETLKEKGAGQADTIFLLVIDTEKKKTTILNISRDSIVDVNAYDENMNYQGIKNEQICLAYAYGDGKEKSCENMITSVKRLLYGMPIDSYISMNLSGINVLNDAVGGVNVTVLEDLSKTDPELTEGANVTLIGPQAETYVRYRDVYSSNIATNNNRMARQRQYVSAFISKVLSESKQDITLPIDLYQLVSEYSVTNIKGSEMAALASMATDCGVLDSEIITVPGTVTKKNGFANYNVDDKALFKIILDVFYNKE
ncbi:MAG: LCP family protein [Lachnospiraceae bacterium]|nr:LCP family protein [Lachnospiraceae bacterium]